MESTATGYRCIIRLPVAVFSLLLFFYLPSIAADNFSLIKQQASNLYFGRGVNQDYSKALSLYLQAANGGDPEAQYIVGGMYFKGYGTPVDYNKAFRWMYTAARNGKSTVQSQKIIGQAFLIGRGVPKNYEEARRWYNLAADKGDPEALNELAFMYFVGNGVEPDQKKAFELFMRAAKKGLTLAQYNVGIMLYTSGTGAEEDLIDAYAWLSLASIGGNTQAGQALQFIESILTRDQLNTAQQRAAKLFDELQMGRESKP